jgi:ATP-binding cassette, subfamily F, member 2
MTGDLNPTKGAVKRNMHLKISRFTQHFEEKLDLSMTPLDFFKQKVMPKETIEFIRPLLGRYGCTGNQQSQIMEQLSAGQKARIVFAMIAHEKPHLLMLDEPTNPLDMECTYSTRLWGFRSSGGWLLDTGSSFPATFV